LGNDFTVKLGTCLNKTFQLFIEQFKKWNSFLTWFHHITKRFRLWQAHDIYNSLWFSLGGLGNWNGEMTNWQSKTQNVVRTLSSKDVVGAGTFHALASSGGTVLPLPGSGCHTQILLKKVIYPTLFQAPLTVRSVMLKCNELPVS
jgi:hypothetical protein